MNFRTGVRTALAVAGLTLAGSTASAQTSVSGLATISPTQTVYYVPFAVTTAGTFRFYTSATAEANDPQLVLLAGSPGAFGTFLGTDDDGCAPPLCPLRDDGDQRNALIIAGLATGDYTLAISRFGFSEAEARAGFNASAVGDFPTPFTIDSETGVAVTQMSTVPEPSSIALMATGLAGLVGAVRRRKSA